MVKRLDTFVSENRKSVKRLDSTFIPISGQNDQSLSFNSNAIDVEVNIKVYTRSLNNSLISGHPDSAHGSGQGESGDVRGDWTLVRDTSESKDFLQTGRNLARDSLAGVQTAYFFETGVGTDSSDVNPEESALGTETGRDFAWAKPGSQSNESVAESVFLFNEFGDTIDEFGVFSSDGGLYNRVVTQTVDPSSSEELRVETSFTVTGDGTGTTAFTNTGQNKVAESLRSVETTVQIGGMAFGSGSSTPQQSDTSLDIFEFRKIAERQTASETVTAHVLVLDSEPSSQPVDITEIGVEDNNGNLIWRAVIDTLSKNSDFEFDAFVGFRIT